MILKIVIDADITKDNKTSESFLTCSFDKKKKITKDAPKIIAVTEYVAIFLNVIYFNVWPMLVHIMSSGYGALFTLVRNLCSSNLISK